MDKKALSLYIVALALIIGIVGVVFSGCQGDNGQNKTEKLAYVTMDVNPSVELVVSEKGIVLAINGLNDDGKVLIVGEELVGKNIDEVTDILFSLMVDMDYINDGKTNAVHLSIATESEGLEALIRNSVEECATEIRAAYDVTVEAVSNLSHNALVEAVLHCHPELSQEEVNAMTNDELIAIMKVDMLEKAEFALVAIEEQYYEMKEMEFKFKYYEEMKSAIKGFDALRIAAFNMTMALVESGIDTLRTLEAELLEARVNADFIIVNGISVVGTAVDIAMKAVDGCVDMLEGFFETLKEYEEEFTKEIDADALLKSAEDYINDSKDSFFARYGAEFEELLSEAKEKTAAKKAELTQKAA